MTTMTVEGNADEFMKAYADATHPFQAGYADVQSYTGWDMRLVICKVRDIQDIRRRYNAMLEALQLASQLISKGQFDEAKAVADSGAFYGIMKTTDESPTQEQP
jgi:soluble cytochrome b562